MPYKNIEERRLKQKLKKREQREKGRQTINELSPQNNIEHIHIECENEILIEKEKEKENEGRRTTIGLSSLTEKRKWTWTINGVVVPLSMTDAMPLAYI